jgi:hypothetical protein
MLKISLHCSESVQSSERIHTENVQVVQATLEHVQAVRIHTENVQAKLSRHYSNSVQAAENTVKIIQAL